MQVVDRYRDRANSPYYENG